MRTSSAVLTNLFVGPMDALKCCTEICETNFFNVPKILQAKKFKLSKINYRASISLVSAFFVSFSIKTFWKSVYFRWKKQKNWHNLIFWGLKKNKWDVIWVSNMHVLAAIYILNPYFYKIHAKNFNWPFKLRVFWATGYLTLNDAIFKLFQSRV